MNKKQKIEYFKKMKKHAAERGNWGEVKRLNKVIMFNEGTYYETNPKKLPKV